MLWPFVDYCLSGSFTNEGLVTSTADGDTYNAIDPNLVIGAFFQQSKKC